MNNYAYYPFEFGFLKIGYTQNNITQIQVVNNINDGHMRSHLSNKAHGQIMEYFAGERKSFDFPIKLCGTPFQMRVWEELCKIPYGETRTYKQIAEIIGNPKACRAVGMANNKNPVVIAVPCHRVIGTNGKLVGYAGGIEMKNYVLELEKENK